MTSQPAHRTPAPPTRAELAERDAFAARTTDSLSAVRASAQAWRNGLTAFITLTTTGVIIKGRDITTGTTTPWRAAITLMIAGGLLLAIGGLWQALAAEAGDNPSALTLADIRSKHVTLAAYDIAVAKQAGRQLRRAQRIVACAVVMLLAGITLTWWAPPRPLSPPAYLKITHEGATACGTPQALDAGQVRLDETGSTRSSVIRLAEITRMTIVASCP